MSNIQIDTKEIWEFAKVLNEINTPDHNADRFGEVINKLLKKYFPNLNVVSSKRDKTNNIEKYQQEPDRYALYYNVFTDKEKNEILEDNAIYGKDYVIKTYDVNNCYEFSIEHISYIRNNEEANVEEIVHYGWLNSHRLIDGEVDFEDTRVSETSGSIASITGFITQLIIGISLWEEEQNEKGSNDEV